MGRSTPSAEHEVVIELFRRSPDLVTELLSSRFGVSVSPSVSEAFPAYEAALDMVFESLGAEGVAAYDDLVKAVTSAAVRDEWSRYMSTTAIPRMWLSDEYQQSFEKGWVKGEVKSLLRLLSARGFDVSESLCDRVMGVGHEQLERWLDRVLAAPALDDVFAD
ncbi:MAG: hypothetical protein QM621_10180 [Aeromicrobium sp.]|uniref:hypothetical protein n=1 Tax=Aeromicrobium sp. TaxID=1871063 RepID=UPI0039E55558